MAETLFARVGGVTPFSANTEAGDVRIERMLGYLQEIKI